MKTWDSFLILNAGAIAILVEFFIFFFFSVILLLCKVKETTKQIKGDETASVLKLIVSLSHQKISKQNKKKNQNIE